MSGADAQPRLHDGLRVAIVACEASGDILGAGLLEALRARCSRVDAFGMTGPRMADAGCDSWNSIDEVSVMGIAEVLPHLRRLLRLRGALADRIVESRPDVFIGIDSPDFNRPIAAAVKRAGIPTVQYVSPQVWAWRQSRVADIRNAIDKVLCVLPFEVEFFAKHGVDAEFVGHPLADAIPFEIDAAAARARIGASPASPLVAILPGSRRSEVVRLARPFLETASWLQRERPSLQFAVALANDGARALVESVLGALELEPRPLLVQGRTRDVLAAADVVLTASGTATLETLLLRRRMIVAHRIAGLTYWIVRKLGVAKLPYFSLPNLLSGRRVVPEFVQRQVRADVLGPALLDLLDGRGLDPSWAEEFDKIHRQLRRGASAAAAEAILRLIDGSLHKA
jgi:lipid-A-disaccharide synthase